MWAELRRAGNVGEAGNGSSMRGQPVAVGAPVATATCVTASGVSVAAVQLPTRTTKPPATRRTPTTEAYLSCRPSGYGTSLTPAAEAFVPCRPSRCTPALLQPAAVPRTRSACVGQRLQRPRFLPVLLLPAESTALRREGIRGAAQTSAFDSRGDSGRGRPDVRFRRAPSVEKRL